jgi:hypothetical protein
MTDAEEGEEELAKHMEFRVYTTVEDTRDQCFEAKVGF